MFVGSFRFKKVAASALLSGAQRRRVLIDIGHQAFERFSPCNIEMYLPQDL